MSFLIDNKATPYKASVIIPCYNGELYVGQAIESVLNQTHKNFEVLVINDGSTDGSEAIIKNYCLLDNRIKYLFQENKGVSVARNCGILQAQGDYVAFLDADDAWEPENLETKINAMVEDDSIAWVFSDVYLADESLNKTEVIEGGDDSDILNSLLLRKGDVIHAPSNIIVRRDCLGPGKVLFDPNLSTSADWDFCVQLTAKKFKGKRIPIPLWSYRVLANSMSRNIKGLEMDNLLVLRKAKEQKFFKSFWFKQNCFSNNYLILAGCWWVNGHNKWKGAYFILRTVLSYPPNIIKLFRKLQSFNLYLAKRTPIRNSESFLGRNLSFKGSKNTSSKNVTVFLFHRINVVRDPLWNPIHPEHFEQTITYLKKHFEFVPLRDYLLGEYRPETGKPLCTIGFDDGYRDYLEYALPILKKHNCPSSMYVVTDCIDKDLPPWTYMLNHYFINTQKLSIDIDTSEFPGHLKRTHWRTKGECLLFAKQLNPYMKSLSNELREKVYDAILSELNDVAPPHGLMLTWEEIGKLEEYKCEVGSHTVSHPMLSKQLSHERLVDELKRSGETIQKHTGIFPATISYPFGAYNEEVKKASEEVGYKIGVTVNPEPYDSHKHDLFEIPRIELFDEPFLKTKLRINEIVPRIIKILSLKG